ASCPVPLGAVTEKTPQRRSYVVHGNPAPTARAAASQVGINIVDLHVCEAPFQCAIPPQEMTYLTPKLLDGGFAQSAFLPRPAAVLAESLFKRAGFRRRVQITEEPEPGCGKTQVPLTRERLVEHVAAGTLALPPVTRHGTYL